jgi:hypothetical protein
MAARCRLILKTLCDGVYSAEQETCRARAAQKKEKQKTRPETGSALEIYFLDSFYVLEINYLYSLYLAISIRDSAFKALLIALFFDLPPITQRTRDFYCSVVNAECGC